jgi:hypothetical protein
MRNRAENPRNVDVLDVLPRSLQQQNGARAERRVNWMQG